MQMTDDGKWVLSDSLPCFCSGDYSWCTAATRADGSQLVVYASSQAGVCCLYPVISLYASVVSTCDCTGFPLVRVRGHRVGQRPGAYKLCCKHQAIS
jgi:hypothetical protein